MWKNHLKIAFRNLWKQKSFSAINIFGLALGMACCFLIVQYVWHETSYDRFHPNLDRLYRVSYHVNFSTENTLARIPPAFSSQMPDYFPEIEQVARMYPRDVSVKVSDSQEQFELDNVLFVDSNMTQIFLFDFLHGNPQTALDQPFSVVITDEMALKLFGRTDVLGKELQLVEADHFKVTGVIKAWPDNTHLDINMLVPYKNMVDLEPPHAQEGLAMVLERNWTASHSYTYVLLKENQRPETVDAKFPAYIQQFGTENTRDKQAFSLFPVKDIHLHSTLSLEPKVPANLNMLYLFIGIGIITLLIACINFINLTTASSLNRAKEVGVRKTLGASRGLLIGQFLGESFLLSFIAFLLSISLARMALPYLNTLSGVELEFTPWEHPGLMGIFMGIFILAALLAGSYPAFFVSKFQAVSSLKGRTAYVKKPGGVTLRKALITLQFLATIVFISGAAIMYLQLNYLQSQPLGFAKEHTLRVPIDNAFNFNAAFRGGDQNSRQKMNTLDDLLLRHPNIKAVTQCARTPGNGVIGRIVWNDHVKQEEAFSMGVNSVDYDFTEAFDLEIIAGRDFDLSYGTDHINSFLINEQAVTALGWESPEAAIGQRLVESEREGKVVGVLKDFHFRSLYTEIQPLIHRVQPGEFSNFAIRLENAKIPESLAFIESQWKEFYPGKTFEYHFLDESFNDAYATDQRLMTIIIYFALIAIFISCFGLFGLAAMLTQHRFKEIGIRKVLGASVAQILHILSTDFLKLIGIAMLLALPIIWYFSNQWMENFAFHIDFPWWLPLLIGIGVILIAFLTISSKTIKAALSNPVEALRHE